MSASVRAVRNNPRMYAAGRSNHLIYDLSHHAEVFSAMLLLILVDVVALQGVIALFASQSEQYNDPFKLPLEMIGCVFP